MQNTPSLLVLLVCCFSSELHEVGILCAAARLGRSQQAATLCVREQDNARKDESWRLFSSASTPWARFCLALLLPCGMTKVTLFALRCVWSCSSQPLCEISTGHRTGDRGFPPFN